jgi:hypothetical protein
VIEEQLKKNPNYTIVIKNVLNVKSKDAHNADVCISLGIYRINFKVVMVHL